MEGAEFKVIAVHYLWKPLGGMVQLGSRTLEAKDFPGIRMRETTFVISLWMTTFEFTRRKGLRLL